MHWQTQQEDWQVLWVLLKASSTLATASVVGTGFPHITFTNMGLQDNPEAFVKLFD